MQLFLTVLHLLLALGLIGLILIQHGKGADAGAAFGSGASATVFGARGSGSFLTRLTAIMATTFFLTSMALAYFAAQVGEPEGLMDDIEAPALPSGADRAAPAPGDLPAPMPEDAPEAAGESGVGAPAPDLPPVEMAPAASGGTEAEGDLPPVPAEPLPVPEEESQSGR
jgi:preprotein translocase subunit SecG